MSEEMFGPDGNEEWGGEMEAGDPGGESVSSGVQDLGGGTFMRIPEEAIRGLLRAPEAIAAITHRAKAVVDIANDTHITQDAEYEAVLVDNAGYKRPVVFVKPANFKAVIDEKYHSTLLAAALQVGSDPLTEPGTPAGGSSAEMAE